MDTFGIIAILTAVLIDILCIWRCLLGFLDKLDIEYTDEEINTLYSDSSLNVRRYTYVGRLKGDYSQKMRNIQDSTGYDTHYEYGLPTTIPRKILGSDTSPSDDGNMMFTPGKVWGEIGPVLASSSESQIVFDSYSTDEFESIV